MNKIQRAMGIIASAERNKSVNVTSKRRAGTKKASFKMSVDGMNARLAYQLDARPRPKVQTVGSYGPAQSIRVWRKS